MKSDHRTVVLTLITGKDCPLCDEMKFAIQETKTAFRVLLQEVPVDTNQELYEAYKTRYPYLFVAGVPFAKGKVDQRHLSAQLSLAASKLRVGRLPEVVEHAVKTIT